MRPILDGRQLMPDNTRRLELHGKQILLVGTAHISSDSVEEVRLAIREEKPDHVCVEIDAGRFATMTENQSWQKLDIIKVLKEGKGFLLLANLVLSSFQRRMGKNLGITPGDEMKAAVDEARINGIPFSFCDREVQTTLRRAWAGSNLWNKSKLLATLLASTMSNEKLSSEEIEKLKDKSVLDEMMGQLASYLPSVKEVLIDERDRFLATKIFQAPGSRIVAVVGAGHCDGIVEWLRKLEDGSMTADLSDIESVPRRRRIGTIIGWIIPAAMLCLIVLGFVKLGATASLGLLAKWLVIHGLGAAIGTIFALGSPLAILTAFIGSPVVILKPFLSIGLLAALVEAWSRKPQVRDFENLSADILSIRGFYRNKITRILLVFFFASLGGAVGNFISIPIIGSIVL
jgi:pheromone shutdown-related protein TraB